jgi:RNA-directed DNA polymerase
MPDTPMMRCFTAGAGARQNACLTASGNGSRACKLQLHPGKTQIVYCKDINRTGDHPEIQFTFLGYTFRPRKAAEV